MFKNCFRKLCCVWVSIFAIILCFCLKTNAAVPKPSRDFYVYDDYGILSEDVKSYIISTNNSLFDKTGAQIVVALVNSLQGRDIESYTVDMFRSFKIGSSEKNNGILLLCAINDSKVRLEVGYGLEGALPDSKAGRILDEYLIPRFKTKQYEEGIIDTYKAILSVVQQEYNVEIDKSIPSQDYVVDEKSTIRTAIPIAIILLLIIMDLFLNRGRIIRSLLYIIIFSGRNNGGGFGSGGFGGGGSAGGGGSSGGGGASRNF